MSHPFRIIDVPQRSPEWYQARLGLLTGSRAEDALAFTKSGTEAAIRRDYRMALVCERVTGQPQEEAYVTAAMQRAIHLEDRAVAAYEAATGQLVQRTGFLRSLTDDAGCSLDGSVEDFTGIIEVKCPKSATHLRYLQATAVPADYGPQVTHNLFVTGAAWCDFVSFDDRFPPALQLLIIRHQRDEAALATYAMQARAFLAEVQRDVDVVQTLAGIGPVLTSILQEQTHG
jgi:predicted phage-related endonuclease